MPDENNTSHTELYPSVDLAYQIAVASYDSAVKRLDAVDGRIQTILALMVSVTVAIPSLAVARGLRFESIWFVLAMTCACVSIILGIYARLTGDIMLLSPTRLYEGWLHYSEQEFKTNLIYCAGEDFKNNTTLVRRRWGYMVWVIILFLLEALFLMVWVNSHHP